MKRRLLALLLALLLAGSAQAAVTDSVSDTPGTSSPAADAPLLPRLRAYEGQFPDVSGEAWYAGYVAAAYEYGLLNGRGSGFAPEADVTVAELLALSARVRAAYEGETIPAAGAGEAWYLPYVAFLRARGLDAVPDADYDASATRAQLAGVFARSLPEPCYDGRNAALVTEAVASGGYIADVTADTAYREDILWLYRQGLLAGADANGSYRPDAVTTRAETAALLLRMVDPSLRITLDWRVASPWSAEGTTLADLVRAPESTVPAPSYDDGDAIDALLRRMLAAGENVLLLRYGFPLAYADASALATRFNDRVKTYCEQMYNYTFCQTFSDGTAILRFTATACLPEAGDADTLPAREQRWEEASARLAAYREAAMARAVEVHDALWESGQLGADMSQLEIARVYYAWLCEHCEYDNAAVNDEYSLSHIAYRALVEGKAVCDGYTGAYNLFLKLEGIECSALNNATHIWTVATLDGTEYHIDTTWGDQTGYIDLSYFAMTPQQSFAAHAW